MAGSDVLGLGLVGMAEGGPNSPLLRRIAGIRRQLATDLGYLLPPVRVTDNLSLRAREYAVLLKGAEIARFELPPNTELAIAAGRTEKPLEGQATRDPAFGMPAFWISAGTVESARAAGYTVVDSVSVLGTHLAEISRRYAHELFSRQDAKKLLDRVAIDSPRLVEDLVPKLLPLAVVQRVLQNLLRERVSIRDSASILEALGEAAPTSRNPVLLTEYARQAIRRSIVKPYLNAAGELPAYFLEGAVEQSIERATEHGEQNRFLARSSGHPGPDPKADSETRPARDACSNDYECWGALFPSPDRGSVLAKPVRRFAQRSAAGRESHLAGGIAVIWSQGREPHQNEMEKAGRIRSCT